MASGDVLGPRKPRWPFGGPQGGPERVPCFAAQNRNSGQNVAKTLVTHSPFCVLQTDGAIETARTAPRASFLMISADLRGLSRLENRDCLKENCYKENAASSQLVSYPSCKPITDQPRATNPAWEVRDLEQVNWAILPLNPQENTCMHFENNLNTRLLERDNFIPKIPCLKKN